MKKRLLSLLLAVSVLFSAVIGSANAIESVTNKESSPTNNEVTEEEFALPDIVMEVESEYAGYIGRVKEKEPDLNTFVFDNGNGTYTMRVYNHPVKYVDSNGETKDITTDIEAVSGGSKPRIIILSLHFRKL